MPLDPLAKIILNYLPGRGAPPLESLPVEQARAVFESLSRTPLKPPVAHVENQDVPGPGGNIPIRIYRPQGAVLHPVLVFFHGGGFVLGSLETHDNLCRQLAHYGHCAVVSVEYRLAPEHKFPAAVEDAYAALQWVWTHGEAIGIDVRRIAVGGDSAGGNLAAVTAILARDNGGPPLVCQLLFYPATAMTLDTASQQEHADGYFLTRDLMLWFARHYLSDVRNLDHPLAAPLKTSDLSRLPKTLVITAEYDPLRDEGEAFAHRLQERGVRVLLERYAGMIHGFMSMDALLLQGQDAVRKAGRFLQDAFQEPVATAEGRAW